MSVSLSKPGATTWADGRPEAWAPRFGARHDAWIVRLSPGLLVAAPLAWSLDALALALAAAALSWIGMPHGAADDRIARPLLRPLLGRWWMAAFLVLYLAIAGGVLAAALAAPVVSAVAFVATASVHFGLEDTNPRHDRDIRRQDAIEIVALGGAVFALPFLLHPDRTIGFLGLLAGAPPPRGVLTALAAIWAGACTLFWLRRIASAVAVRSARPLAAEAPVAATLLAFLALPPLAAFAAYFLLVHVPRHTAELARRHAPEDPARGWRFALLSGLPMTAAAVPLFAAIVLFLPGAADARFVRATFWGIWALTVPHLLLSLADRRWGRGPLD